VRRSPSPFSLESPRYHKSFNLGSFLWPGRPLRHLPFLFAHWFPHPLFCEVPRDFPPPHQDHYLLDLFPSSCSSLVTLTYRSPFISTFFPGALFTRPHSLLFRTNGECDVHCRLKFRLCRLIFCDLMFLVPPFWPLVSLLICLFSLLLWTCLYWKPALPRSPDLRGTLSQVFRSLFSLILVFDSPPRRFARPLPVQFFFHSLLVLYLFRASKLHFSRMSKVC